MMDVIGSWILLPGRNANCAGSISLCLIIADPSRSARSLLIILPMMGPTEMGRMLSVVLVIPNFLGRAVIRLDFSVFGIFLVRRQRRMRFVRIRRPLYGVMVVCLVVFMGWKVWSG